MIILFIFQLMSTVDLYYNHVRDMIVAVPYNMYVWNCVNLAKVATYGVDVTLRGAYQFDARYRLLFSGHYTYHKAENRTNPDSPYYGNQVAYVPRHTGSAALTFENPFVNISFHGTGVSARWPNNEHYEGTLIDGYVDCGLTAYRAFVFGIHRLEARADLKNVFNKQYEIVGRYPMPGRSYQITINYKF
jgi:outer membrane receptor protein involved in Fe transport